MNHKMIGVVGGIGPYAGVDLVQKIFDLTKADCDQEHLPVCMLSMPHTIADRTEYLVGKTDINPAIALSSVIDKLQRIGASVVGMPCNTAHAAPIFDEVARRIPESVTLVHMIDEVAKYIKQTYPSVTQVGVLSTTGSYTANIYPDYLAKHGLAAIQVSQSLQEEHIHPSIYDPSYGIKTCSNPIAAQATSSLHQGVEYLIEAGAEAIVLGCTEIPLAITEDEINGVPMIDATKILARSLILAAAPESLRKF